ncbi:hypothetical protein KQX54_006385 [Cotesia glomerata]|uniref:Secreted protein n=1 Tax=Cotesia glomerata TaxID=32391 RepID=A0AAV7IN26_COTGL|nr:hypothetical protein KQX54_006385 [Cotesia glomerata]
MKLEIIGIILVSCTQILSEHRDFYGPYNPFGHQRHRHQNWDEDRMTKEVRVAQGRLRGFVVQPKTSPRMQLVDVFLGKWMRKRRVEKCIQSDKAHEKRARESAPILGQRAPGALQAPDLPPSGEVEKPLVVLVGNGWEVEREI